MIMRRLEIDVAVVGGGIAGLSCADSLVRAGARVTVLDKGRGPGGRASRRREGDFHFEHGAPGAQELVGYLAGEIGVDTGARIDALLPGDGGRWSLLQADGATSRPHDLVVVAVPPVQAAELLVPVPALSRLVRGVTMDPCLTAMVGFGRELGLPWLQRRTPGPLAVARRQDLPGTAAGHEAWVLHGSTAFSLAHLEADPGHAAEKLVSEFLQLAGRPLPEPALVKGHRWRYARARRPLGVECLYAPESGIGVCGDWCRGTEVLDASASGRALARRIIGHHLDPPRAWNATAKERVH